MPRNEVFNRDEVIENAMNLFWKKGYNGTSMQDLVDMTGLGRSSIYNSFGSKMDFYLMALNHYKALSADGFKKALMESTNPLESIEKIFHITMIQAFNDNESKGCFIVNCKTEMANSDSQINNWLMMDQKQAITMFEELVKNGQEQGLINTHATAEEHAYFLYNSLQGLRVSSITIKDKNVLDSILKNCLSVLK